MDTDLTIDERMILFNIFKRLCSGENENTWLDCQFGVNGNILYIDGLIYYENPEEINVVKKFLIECGRKECEGGED